jgi:hypothetical protein
MGDRAGSDRARAFALLPQAHGFGFRDLTLLSKAIKERSARNSESEVNGNQSVSLGRQGRLITSISAPTFPRI